MVAELTPEGYVSLSNAYLSPTSTAFSLRAGRHNCDTRLPPVPGVGRDARTSAATSRTLLRASSNSATVAYRSRGTETAVASDASIVIVTRARTTVAARSEDLAVLREEARRRGVTLSVVLSEAVTEAADALREQRRPRFALGRSGVGAARAAAASPDEPIESAAYRT